MFLREKSQGGKCVNSVLQFRLQLHGQLLEDAGESYQLPLRNETGRDVFSGAEEN